MLLLDVTPCLSLALGDVATVQPIVSERICEPIGILSLFMLIAIESERSSFLPWDEGGGLLGEGIGWRTSLLDLNWIVRYCIEGKCAMMSNCPDRSQDHKKKPGSQEGVLGHVTLRAEVSNKVCTR